MRPWKRLLSAAALLLPACALADPVGYAVGSGGPGFGGSSTLYRLDLGTGAATLVGPLGYADVEGLSFAPDGVLYAVADAGQVCEGLCPGSDVLLRIDPESGAATLVGSLGLSAQGDLDYGLGTTCDGRLWLSSDTSTSLWEVNRFTGATRLVGSLGAPVSGLAGWGDALYGISVADDLALYRITPDSGAATRLGALGLPFPFYDAGLDFDDEGQLWATIDYLTPPDDLPPDSLLRNDVALLDPDTGAATLAGTISGAGSGIDTVQMEGLAIATGGGCGAAPPPPDPSVASVPLDDPRALLALSGLLVLAAATRLRRG